MATATLGLLGFTEIDDADTNTSWLGLTTADPDIRKEGTNSMSGVLRADGDNGYYDDGTARSTSGEHLRMWINTTNAPYMEDAAGGGYQVFVYDNTNTDYYTVFSSDDYTGGWFNAVVDCSLFTTVTPANVDRWGLYANHTTNAKNVVNCWVDFIRYMDGYYITGGTSGDKVRLSDIATADAGTTTLYGYGIVTQTEGIYFAYGEIQIGNGSTTTYFEMDGDVLVFTDKPVADGLYQLNGNGSACDIVIVNSTIKASGTGDNNRPDVDMATGTPNSVSITDTVFIRGGTFVFDSGQEITGNTFNDCEQITHGGADMDGCAIVGYEGTTGTGALYYNETADPNGETDNMYFEKGTASTHAIQFGTSAPNSGTSPTTMTLTGITFVGYATTDQQTDSALYFPDTGSDVTWTVNLSGCSGDITYYKARSGDTVTLVADQVTHSLTGLVNGSEVTYMARGTAVDTGSDGSTTADSRSFVTTNSWTTDAYKGHLLYITSGSDAGRYYVSGNNATTLYLDAEMTTTASSLTWELYDENDDTEVWHVESVTGNQSDYTYTYSSDQDVDIAVISTNYVDINLLDVTLGNSSQSIPITQIYDPNYFNPT